MGDILKEAIADAKAVRETALENAKMALEEAFTPQLKSMLSAKLKEEEDDMEDDDKTPICSVLVVRYCFGLAFSSSRMTMAPSIEMVPFAPVFCVRVF